MRDASSVKKPDNLWAVTVLLDQGPEIGFANPFPALIDVCDNAISPGIGERAGEGLRWEDLV